MPSPEIIETEREVVTDSFLSAQVPRPDRPEYTGQAEWVPEAGECSSGTTLEQPLVLFEARWPLLKPITTRPD